MDAFNEMIDKMREVYRLYKREDALRTAVAPGGHNDTEAIRLPVYSFFLKEFLGVDTPLTSEGPVDEPPPRSSWFVSGMACRLTSGCPVSTRS